MGWRLFLILLMVSAPGLADQFRREFLLEQADPDRVLQIVEREFPLLAFARTPRGLAARGDEAELRRLARRWPELDRQRPWESVFVRQGTPRYGDPEAMLRVLPQVAPSVRFEFVPGGVWCTGDPNDLDALAELAPGLGSLQSRAEASARWADVLRAEQLELCSLPEGFHPRPAWFGGRVLQRHPVGHSVRLEGDECAQVLEALWADVQEGSYRLFCFNPHHAVIARSPSHSYELLICYECEQVQLVVDGRQMSMVSLSARRSHALLERYLNSTTPAPAAPEP